MVDLAAPGRKYLHRHHPLLKQNALDTSKMVKSVKCKNELIISHKIEHIQDDHMSSI